MNEEKQKLNQIRKDRYRALRNAGYTSKEAQQLRVHAIDPNNINHTDIKNRLNNMKSKSKPLNNIPQKENFKRVSKHKRVSKPSRDINAMKRANYKALREAGYTTEEASRMRNKNIGIGLNKEGDIKSKTQFKKIVSDLKITKQVDDYKEYAFSKDNDSNYSRWGFLTQIKPHADYTEKTVKYLMRKHHLSNDQAHYFLYMMIQHDLSYERAKNELLSNKEFEMYDQRKKARNQLGSKLKRHKGFKRSGSTRQFGSPKSRKFQEL